MKLTSLQCLGGRHFRCLDSTCACEICRHGKARSTRTKDSWKRLPPKPRQPKPRPSRAKKQPGERRVDLGVPRGVSKLDTQTVIEVQGLLAAGETKKAIVRKTGVSRDQIYTIVHGHSRWMDCKCEGEGS